MNVIDVHAHIVIEETLNTIQGFGPEIGGNLEKPWFRVGNYKLEGVRYKNTPFMDVQLRLEAMEKMGIDFQVLSPNPLTYFHFIDSRLALDYCRLHNDNLAKILLNNNKKLGGFASLPIQDPHLASKELERAVKQLGLMGAYVGTDFPSGFDDSSMDELYQTCIELDVPLFIHPAPQGIESQKRDERLEKFSLDLTVGFSNEESIAIGSIIFGGVLHKFPKLDICISHGGGSIAFLFGRMELAAKQRNSSPEWLRREGEFKKQIKMLWFDNHVHQKNSLKLLEGIVGKKRQVLGTNFSGGDQPKEPLMNTPSYLAKNAKKLLRIN